MRIGEAAAAAGTTPRALRFYEQRGLLPAPSRTTSGQREYGPGEVALVRVIREMLALGLTVDDLRSRAHRLHLLAVDPQPACGSAERSCAFVDVVDRRLALLDAEIDRLTRLRARLAQRAYQPAGADDGGGTEPSESRSAAAAAVPASLATGDAKSAKLAESADLLR